MAEPTAAGSDEFTHGELLGRGLTSDLYKFQHSPAGVAVLLKRFGDHDTNDVRLNKLRWQALWAGAKRYPGLAWMRGVHEDEDGRRTLILERAGDETLEQFLQRNDAGVDVSVALLLVRRLVEALRQAAELGFDYQFLQPATIMLEGETNPILLGLDLAGHFDLAVLAAEAPAEQAAFLAPEQRAGDGSDERSLIYSLGVLLAALLAPWWLYGEDRPAPDGSPEPPAEVLEALQDEVTPETFALLQVALLQDPASRHKDLEAFLEATRAAARAEAAERDGNDADAASLVSPRGWKPSSVPKGVVSAESLDVPEPAPEAATGAGVPLPDTLSPPEATYRSEKRRTRIPLLLLYLLLATVAAGVILLVLEPEIIDRLGRTGAAAEGPLAPSPTVFNLGISTTPESLATTPAPAAATLRPSATSTATDVPATATPTRATVTATRPSPTPTRVTPTATPSPSPSPSATVIVPPPTTVLILPTFTPVPPPPTEPPPPPTEPPPPPPTQPPPPPTPTEAPPPTPTAPSP